MLNKNFLLKALYLGLLILFEMLFSNLALAQSTKHKISYSTINQAGLITASKGEALIVQSINGIKKDKSFVGAGVGLDFYGDRTVPLFLDYRRDFSGGKNTPFAYADAGINFLWLNFIQREQKQFPSSRSGFYYDLGVGWKLLGKHNRGFVVSAGYSMKQEKYKVLSYSIAPTQQMQSENYDRYNFIYRRVVIKIGFQL